MSYMLTGISADTQRRLLRDQGLVYLNYGLAGQVLLGATKGGNSIAIVPEIVQDMHDGQPGDVVGDKHIVKESVKVTINISEAASNQVILAANPGIESVTGSTHMTLTRDRQIAASDYFDNVTLVLQKSGTSEVFYYKFKNCLSNGSYSPDFKEKENAVTTIEFTAHFSVDDLTTAPFEIGNPVEGSTGFFTFTYSAGANGYISIESGYGNPMLVQDSADGGFVTAAGATGYHFDAWSDESTDNPRKDTSATADITVSAVFVED